MARTTIASVCLEPELAKVISMLVDVQGVSVSHFFWLLARNEVIRLGLMENPAAKYMPPGYMPPAPAPVNVDPTAT